MKYLKQVVIITVLSILAGTVVGTVYGSSEIKGDEENFHFFQGKNGEPPKGKPINDYVVKVEAEGVPLFETTSGDFKKNKKYYSKKFGIGKYWRDNHRPVEPKDIEYLPHQSAIERGYPKINKKP